MSSAERNTPVTSGPHGHKPEEQPDDLKQRSDLLLFNGLFVTSNPACKHNLLIIALVTYITYHVCVCV